MKRVVFLIVGILLVLGLVLPGCGGGGGGGAYVPYKTLKTPGTLTIGVMGAMSFDQGEDAAIGAQVAANDIGTFSVGNQTLTVTINSYDTDEVLNPTGPTGGTAAALAVSQCDFVVGGFRTEAVLVYRNTFMNANMTFFDCGAATTSLCQDVVTTYGHYKYFFRATPFNDDLIGVMQTKIFTEALATTAGTLAYYAAHNISGFAGIYNASLPGGLGFIPKVAVIAEDAEWTRAGRNAAVANLGAEGILVNPGSEPYLVSTTATDAQMLSTLNAIHAADPLTNVLYTILSGPAGVSFRDEAPVVFPGALCVGTNVEAQAMQFGNQSTCNQMLFTDGFAPGVSITNMTAPFMNEFAAYVVAHGLTSTVSTVPLYTAGTYDAVKSLVDALHNEGYVDGSTVKYVPGDIVSWLESAVRTDGTSALQIGDYPLWDGHTTGTYIPYIGATPQTNVPALNSSQVLAIYPWLANAKFSNGTAVNNWTYNPNDWTMGPNPSHDLIFGTQWSVGIGSQWQWNGTAYQKVCVWPTTDLTSGTGLNPVTDIPTFEFVLPGLNATTLYSLQQAGLWDQYGWYNYKYAGTGSLNLSNFVGLVIANYPF